MEEVPWIEEAPWIEEVPWTEEAVALVLAEAVGSSAEFGAETCPWTGVMLCLTTAIFFHRPVR